MGAFMEFRLLGPGEVRSGDQLRPISAPRLWCILVSLLMTPGVPVPHETLVDRLWGTQPPAKALEDLRAYVSRLGRLLRDVADDDTRLVAQSHGYALAVDPQAVDLHRFRLLSRQADVMAQSGDNEESIALLRSGNALWRGQALSGIPGDYLARIRASLEEERRAAIVKRIDLELRQGHHAGLIGELGQLTDQHPLDEALLGQRMTALYRAGRQADALTVYREARDRFVDYGFEPGPALSRLHQAILRHDQELSITPVFRRPGRAPQPDTLPPDTGGFVGRTAELGKIIQRSKNDAGPFVDVIEGMPGARKTTLAVNAARQLTARFPDAQLFIDFRNHAPGQIPLRTAEALYLLLEMLEIPAGRIPANVRERAQLWQAELAHRRMIIVLDDIRDLADVRDILPGTGDNLTLITTRHRLTGPPGAASQALDVLPLADAITLFTQVSGQIGEANQVARVVRMCGCLPLAIRISASWLRHQDSPDLSGLLDELTAPAGESDPAGPLGQQIMSAFTISYHELAEEQRVLFRRLGTSPCPETGIHAAATLTGQQPDATQQVLHALVARHLLTEPSPGRYKFHDIIHTYAASCSAQEDPESDRRDASSRLLNYYLHTTEAAAQSIFSGGRRNPGPAGSYSLADPAANTLAGSREWFKMEWRNILLIAEYAAHHEQKRQCADLVDALADFLERNGHWEEAVKAHSLALQASRDLNDYGRAGRAALALSMVELLTGQQEPARGHADEAVELSRRLGDRCGEAAALDQVGIVCHQAAQFRDALAYHQESCDIYREAGAPRGMALALCHAGTAYAALGRLSDTVASFRQAFDLYCQISDKRGEAATLNNIGYAQQELGYYKDAMRNYENALHLLKELDDQQNVAVLLHNTGIIYQYKGDHSRALPIFRRALAIYRALGDVRLQADIYCDIGSSYQYQEHYGEALAHHEKARAMAQDIGERSIQAKATCGIAEAHQGWGRYSAAFDAFQEALQLAREIESPAPEAKALQGMGDTVLHTGRLEAARIYWRQALEIYRQMGVPEATILEIRLETLSASA